LQPNADYTIDYEQGKIMLRQPLQAQLGFGTYEVLVVRYEYDPGPTTASVRGALGRFTLGPAQIGYQEVIDDSRNDPFALRGGWIRLDLPARTDLIAEYAENPGVEGAAAHQIRLTHVRDGGTLTVAEECTAEQFANPYWSTTTLARQWLVAWQRNTDLTWGIDAYHRYIETFDHTTETTDQLAVGWQYAPGRTLTAGGKIVRNHRLTRGAFVQHESKNHDYRLRSMVGMEYDDRNSRAVMTEVEYKRPLWAGNMTSSARYTVRDIGSATEKRRANLALSWDGRISPRLQVKAGVSAGVDMADLNGNGVIRPRASLDARQTLTPTRALTAGVVWGQDAASYNLELSDHSRRDPERRDIIKAGVRRYDGRAEQSLQFERPIRPGWLATGGVIFSETNRWFGGMKYKAGWWDAGVEVSHDRLRLEATYAPDGWRFTADADYLLNGRYNYGLGAAYRPREHNRFYAWAGVRSAQTMFGQQEAHELTWSGELGYRFAGGWSLTARISDKCFTTGEERVDTDRQVVRISKQLTDRFLTGVVVERLAQARDVSTRQALEVTFQPLETLHLTVGYNFRATGALVGSQPYYFTIGIGLW
jgi:hypothetical protein